MWGNDSNPRKYLAEPLYILYRGAEIYPPYPHIPNSCNIKCLEEGTAGCVPPTSPDTPQNRELALADRGAG